MCQLKKCIIFLIITDVHGMKIAYPLEFSQIAGSKPGACSHNRTFYHLISVPLMDDFTVFGNDRINVIRVHPMCHLPALHSCRRCCRKGTGKLTRSDLTLRIRCIESKRKKKE
jgi:hypothetical protein